MIIFYCVSLWHKRPQNFNPAESKSRFWNSKTVPEGLVKAVKLWSFGFLFVYLKKFSWGSRGHFLHIVSCCFSSEAAWKSELWNNESFQVKYKQFHLKIAELTFAQLLVACQRKAGKLYLIKTCILYTAVERTAGRRVFIDSFDSPLLFTPPPTISNKHLNFTGSSPLPPFLKPVGIKTFPLPRAPWFGSIRMGLPATDIAFTVAEISPRQQS